MIRPTYLSKKELAKEIMRLILKNDYSVYCAFRITGFVEENLESNQEWLRKQGCPFWFKLKKIEGKLHIVDGERLIEVESNSTSEVEQPLGVVK